MRKIVLLSLLALQIFAVAVAGNITVTGRITSGNKPVASVAVTDGVTVVVTDTKGNYVLPTNTQRPYVYYSLPSGYESPVTDGVPVFYKPIAARVDFELTPSARSQQKHAFIVWADPQVRDTDEIEQLKEVIEDVRASIGGLSDMPVHAISCGDQVFDRLNLFDPYKQAIASLGIPFYQAIGNHDMDYNGRSDELSDISFAKSFGPTHFSFNRGKIHYVVLKDLFYYGYSSRYAGYVSEEQLKWLEQDLAAVPAGSTVVVALHIPTINGQAETIQTHADLSGSSVVNNAALYKILEPYNAHILAGHSHTQWNTVISPKLMEHTHAAASAAWWQGEVALDGTPKGYTVYVADGGDLTWHFKGVGKSKEEQFKVYTLGAHPAHPNSVIANVFNYDPSWTVVWSENGKNRGAMEQYYGEDPLAAKLYVRGENKKYSWLGANKTHHLFRATPADPAAKVVVTVTDRFGNVYEQSPAPWKLVWSEEFDYTGSPDSTKWNYQTDGNARGWGNNEAQHYTSQEPKNAWVSDGTLKINAIREKTEGREYSSARLTTKGKGDWLYGRFEIRAKLPTGVGTWPAIWMLSTDNTYGRWPASGEIDIMENVGYDPDTIVGTVHTKSYNHAIRTQVGKRIALPTAYTQFHTYILEWDPQEIRLYVDDTHYFTFKNEGTGSNEWPFDKPFHMIFNLAIGGNWGGRKGIDDTRFPHTMEVDYVRVYQK